VSQSILPALDKLRLSPTSFAPTLPPVDMDYGETCDPKASLPLVQLATTLHEAQSHKRNPSMPGSSSM